jgi:hypothetical protein
MAAKRSEDTLTTAVTKEETGYTGPYVSVFLPELEGGGEDGIKVDQYEHVTLANEEKETIYRVHRGEHVEVPVPVFMALKERYPKL